MTTTEIHTEALADTVLQASCVLKAKPDRVYEAWTNPEQFSNWFSASPEMKCELPEFDCQVGGKYRFSMVSPDGTKYIGFGRYLVLDRPKRISFTWQWEESGTEKGESKVTIDLSPEGDGTRLVLTHERLASTESRDLHSEGWTGCLSRLVTYFDTQ